MLGSCLLRLGSGQWSDRQTDRGYKGRVPQKRKQTEKDFVKNGKKERAKKEKRVIKRAGKVR